MATSFQYSKRSLKEDILNRPYEFEFVQAVHLLRRVLFENPTADDLQSDEKPYVFKSRVFLSLPPSDVHTINLPYTEEPQKYLNPQTRLPVVPEKVEHFLSILLSILEQQKEKRTNQTKSPLSTLDTREKTPPSLTPDLLNPIEIYVNFLGIAGMQGPLPLPYTENLLNQHKKKDLVFQDFLDIFNHRLISILYSLYEKFYPTLGHRAPEETLYGHALKALMGWTDIFSSQPLVPHFLMKYTRFFWKKHRNPSDLKAILEDFFQMKVTIYLFGGKWCNLQQDQYTILDKKGQNNVLGRGVVLGRRVWSQRHSITLVLHHTTSSTLKRFLPQQKSFDLLIKIVNFYLQKRCAYRLAHSVIQKEKSFLSKDQIYLGWSSWLGSAFPPPSEAHPKDRYATVTGYL